ncbi:cytochrome P450 [Actinoplanes sp. NPDC051411]|uniref:cytochrome P450 family protein n=1 Tax=Actinoplanes sp. NPDC051411 TaxID=3155522 RepID=UPI00342E0F87
MNSPELVLDPTARRRASEEAVLHAADGPVLVDILGELAWAVGDPDLLRQLLSDPRVSKDPRQHWPRFIEGEIVGKWPLYLQVSVDNMFTAYGQAHRRLRRLVSPVFAARRLDGFLPSIEKNTAELLDDLAARDSGPVDLRQSYAVQLPVRVMSDFLGIPSPMRGPFKETIDRIWNTTSSAEDAMAATGDVYAMLTSLITLKRETPGDDLTTGLVQTPELTDRELVDTLLLIVAAGYETTVNLIDNAIAALLTDPDQVAQVRAGRATWGDVVEETMRFAAPVSHMPMRYAVSDIPLPGGAVIRQGEAILPSFGAASNHPRHQPAGTAGAFDVTREDKSHVALGHGVHFCLGAPLARAEGATALAGLFDRFPEMRLAQPAASLEPVPSILGNGHVALPVHL